MGRTRGEALFAAISFSFLSIVMAFLVFGKFEQLRSSVIVLLSIATAYIPGLIFIWLGHCVDLLEKKGKLNCVIRIIQLVSIIFLIPGLLGALAYAAICKFYSFSNDYSGPDQAALKAVVTIFILISIPAIWAIID